MKKRASPYLVFSNEHRAGVAERLRQDDNGNGKPTVAAVAKEIGRMWKELDDEKKAEYKKIANERFEDNEEQSKENDTAKKAPPSLPVSLIKRMMAEETDVKRVGHDATKAMVYVAGLFLEQCAQKCAGLLTEKRSTIRDADVELALKRDGRLDSRIVMEAVREKNKPTKRPRSTQNPDPAKRPKPSPDSDGSSAENADSDN